jgi:hypothetical protein
MNHTVIGLYQFAKSISPLAYYHINRLLGEIFDPTSLVANLIDPKTMKIKQVEIKPKDREAFTVRDGLESTMEKLLSDHMAKSPIMVGKYYLMLIEDNGDTVTLLRDIDEATDKKKVRPITLIELFYIALVDVVGDIAMDVTRFPIAAEGNTYPSKLYVKSTTKGRKVVIKDAKGLMVEKQTYEYVRLDKPVFNSMAPHFTKLARMGADFDGDKGSGNSVMSKEANREINDLLNSSAFYVNMKGKLVYELGSDISTYAELTLTKGLSK